MERQRQRARINRSAARSEEFCKEWHFGAALVTFGWLSFVCSFLTTKLFLTMVLQSIARVLPQTVAGV